MGYLRFILFILMLFINCSNSNTGLKIYKTTVSDNGLQLFTTANDEDQQIIQIIPFKTKVEIIDKYFTKNKEQKYIKIKYKDIEGYVLAEYLSDRDDIPFVDYKKFDYAINEFTFNKESVFNATKQRLRTDKHYKLDVPDYYYLKDFQIFSLYGRDCDDKEIKIIAVIVFSKLHPNFNIMLCFLVQDNNLINYGGQGGNVIESEIDNIIKRLQSIPDCCGC